MFEKNGTLSYIYLNIFENLHFDFQVCFYLCISIYIHIKQKNVKDVRVENFVKVFFSQISQVLFPQTSIQSFFHLYRLINIKFIFIIRVILLFLFCQKLIKFNLTEKNMSSGHHILDHKK